MAFDYTVSGLPQIITNVANYTVGKICMGGFALNANNFFAEMGY